MRKKRECVCERVCVRQCVCVREKVRVSASEKSREKVALFFQKIFVKKVSNLKNLKNSLKMYVATLLF